MMNEHSTCGSYSRWLLFLYNITFASMRFSPCIMYRNSVVYHYEMYQIYRLHFVSPLSSQFCQGVFEACHCQRRSLCDSSQRCLDCCAEAFHASEPLCQFQLCSLMENSISVTLLQQITDTKKPHTPCIISASLVTSVLCSPLSQFGTLPLLEFCQPVNLASSIWML